MWRPTRGCSLAAARASAASAARVWRPRVVGPWFNSHSTPTYAVVARGLAVRGEFSMLPASLAHIGLLVLVRASARARARWGLAVRAKEVSQSGGAHRGVRGCCALLPFFYISVQKLPAFSYVNMFCIAFLYGHTGRLTAKNVGFRRRPADRVAAAPGDHGRAVGGPALLRVLRPALPAHPRDARRLVPRRVPDRGSTEGRTGQGCFLRPPPPTPEHLLASFHTVSILLRPHSWAMARTQPAYSLEVSNKEQRQVHIGETMALMASFA
jgi:hypothetical protein